MANHVRSSLPIQRATDVPISSSITVTFDTNYVVSMNTDTVLTIVPSTEGTATFDAAASTELRTATRLLVCFIPKVIEH